MHMARAAALILSLVALFCCSREPAPLKVGAVLSLTGPAAYLGEPERNTLLMLQEELNAKGGVDGHKVELIVYDDASDVARCIQAAIRLIEEDHVAVVIGPSTSGNTLAVRQLFGPARVPLVSCAAAERIVKPVDPWVFNSAQLDRHAVGKILSDARRKGYTRLAIITVADGYGMSGREVLQQRIPAQGLVLVADEVFGPNDTDMSVQLGKIRDAGPDAVICWGTNPGSAQVARDRARMGLSTPLYLSHAVASTQFLKLVGAAGEGLILPAGRLVAVGQVPESYYLKPFLVRYVERYTNRFGVPPTIFGGYAHDALMYVVSAVQAGKSVKSQDIRDNMERIKGLTGTSGSTSMSAENHNGLDEGGFLMVTIEKGEWKVLD